MKKYLFLLVFAFATSAIQAQNNDMYSLMYHDWPGHFHSVQGLMQQRNCDCIINTYLVETPGNFNYVPLGFMFYKMSPTTLTITDSLFIADTTMTAPTYFFAPNPHGEGNIRTNLEFHEDCDSTFIRVSRFPDTDLSVNPDEDVMVPVCEGFATGRVSIVDCRGDLILQYYKEREALHYDEYAARFDLDGTLKCQALLHANEIDGQGASQLQLLKESPMEYFQWNELESDNGLYENIVVYVIDSLFHKNPVIINSILSSEYINTYDIEYEYFYVDGDTQVIPIGGDDVLVAAKYVNDTNFYGSAEHGVTVAKFDIRTMQKKGYIVFNDYPGGYYNQGECRGIKIMSDGTVYFVYKEDGYPAESIVVVKMDTDLNVEWKRFCKTDNINIISWFEYSIMCKDEEGEEKGVACGLKPGNEHSGLLYFYLTHDGTVGMNEGGVEVRPYIYYPNPVKEQLLMQFSPDVQPAQVELYDLQGRLARTQNKAFESINMSQLPAGTYTLRVTMEDGKSYSDKVVKE